jgi:hypothetical protein
MAGLAADFAAFLAGIIRPPQIMVPGFHEGLENRVEAVVSPSAHRRVSAFAEGVGELH